MDRKELKSRIIRIRNYLLSAHVTIPSGSGLDNALREAEAFADSIKSTHPPTNENVLFTALASHLAWNLADILDACSHAGLDFAPHLQRMKIGSVDFGTPALSNRYIYFKDFEFELFVTSGLLQQTLNVAVQSASNDPRFDVKADGIRIEAKHPNSKKKMSEYIGDFQGELEKANTYGFLATALEDACNMG